MLGEMVAINRACNGWSQQQLADACRVSRTYVSRIERDKTPGLSIWLLCRLARALHFQPVTLLTSWRITYESMMVDAPQTEEAE